MKNKLIKSTLLTSALVLSMSSSMAMSIYSAETIANGGGSDYARTLNFGDAINAETGSTQGARGYAHVNGHTIGSLAQTAFGGTAYGEAKFTQQFWVVDVDNEAGSSGSIGYSLDGTLTRLGNSYAEYIFEIYPSFDEDGGLHIMDSVYVEGPESLSYQSEDDDAFEFDIPEGTETFWITMVLKTFASGQFAQADFSETASLGSFSNNLATTAPAAVPVPAAVWLFGSALVGLVGVRRKKAIS